MNMSLLLLRRLRIRWTICLLILMRVMQACGDSEITGGTDSFFSGYLQQNSVGFAAFMVFPMLMGMCAAILPRLHDGSLAVRAGSRERLATAALACSLMVGLFASIAIGVTAIASLAIKGLFPSDTRGVVLSCLLMALSITVSYLIACTGSLLSRSNALAVGCGLIYGMWDFMAINVVGGGHSVSRVEPDDHRALNGCAGVGVSVRDTWLRAVSVRARAVRGVSSNGVHARLRCGRARVKGFS